MKILCLHPWGTSSLIFEKQLATLSDMLGPTHEYVYINGGFPCARARALPDFVTGPFYCWYEGLSSPQCQEAHDAIAETIEEEGPFDGVIGFSQGASVAMSFILHRELHNPGQRCPFRFALFICSNLIVSPDPKFFADKIHRYSRYYKAVGDEVKAVGNIDEDEELNAQYRAEAEGDGALLGGSQNGTARQAPPVNGTKPRAAPKHRAMLLLPGKKEALVEELVHLVKELTKNLPGEADASRYAWPKDGRPEDFPRLMHPLTLKTRVPCPSVHVIARDDPFIRHGELAVQLCEKSKTKVIHFNGGHQVPTALPTLRSITKAMEWAIQKAQTM